MQWPLGTFGLGHRAEAVEAGPQGRCWVSRVKDDDHLFLFQTLVFESANIIIRWASTRMNLASSNRSVRGSEREGDLVGSAWLGHKPYCGDGLSPGG